MESEMRRSYMVIIEPDDDDVYIATVPSFPGVVEQGDTLEEALENMHKALSFTLDCMIEDEEIVPESDALEGKQVRNIELAM